AQKRAHIEILIAEAFWGNGEYQRALEQVLGWEIRYPEAPDEGKARARLIHGRALAGLGKNDEAREHFKYIIEKPAKSPSALEARFELARLLEKEKCIKAAVEAYLDFVSRGEAKEAGDRWFVREARERLLALLLRLGCSEPVSPGAVALVPFHEKALELIIESARTGDESSLQTYINGLNAIAGRYISGGAPTAAANAVGKVLAALPETSRHFPVVLLLLGRAHFAEGAKMFQENLERTGVSAEEEKPNEKFAAAVQVFLRAAKFPDAQDAAIAGVKSVAEFYAQKGIPNPAIVVYTQLLDGRPPRADDVKATLAQMYFRKEKSDAAKLAEAFLPVPEKLGDSAKKALAIIKEVASAGRESAAARNALYLAQEIAHFYAQLYYYEVAREALYLLLDKPPAANQKPEGALADFVMYAGADVSKIEADRDFHRRDSMFGGIKDSGQPTELHRAVLKAYQDVIGSYPESPLVVSARRQMTHIAEMYLNKSAFDAAREVYRQIASANAKWSGAEKMTYMAGKCLHLKANETFGKWMSAAKEGAKPEKLSAEYDAAIKGYIEMIKARPDGFYVSNAYRDIRGVALTYARAGAWDIASTVYGRLLDEKLSYCYPEQVRFERAMCETGKVMPEHALEMLELIAREPVPIGRLGGLKPASRDFQLKTSSDWGSLPGRDVDILRIPPGWEMDLKKSIDELREQKNALEVELEKSIDKLRMQGAMLKEAREPASQAEQAEKEMEERTEELGGVPSDEKYREMYVKVRQKEAELARKISQLESNIQSETQGKMALQQRRPVNVEDYYENIALIKDKIVRISIITEEEIKRRVEALNAAYKMFQAIIREYEGKPAAYKARAEIMIAIGHLRSIHAHNHAAAMLAQFIVDNPKDGELAQLSLRLRMDYLAWAHTAPDPKMEEMDRLAETGGRFKTAREELDKFINDPAFRDEREALETARMALAKSFLDEARLVGALSPTQARGRYVRAAKELLQLAREGGKTVSAGAVFSPVWQIAMELESRRFWEDAIDVYRMLVRQYPVRARVNQTGLRIANAYHTGVKDYLRAVEAYQEFL
ncbi:MAG: hypothetical protein ABIH04_03200, partial [Planctomycetota bacterium]